MHKTISPVCLAIMISTTSTDAATLSCATIATGAVAMDTGMVLSIGQPAIGAASTDTHRLYTGVMGCLGFEFTSDPPNPCPTDIDHNGDTGFGDILAILAAWGMCPPPCPADVNHNRQVDFADILAVIGAWGACR